jgi:hypothetical protein
MISISKTGWIVSLVIFTLLSVSCSKERIKKVAPEFVFKHYVNGFELQKNAMKYTNLAGNLYQVDELQYFISEVTLNTADGQALPITSDSAIHYVDIDIPSTLTWSPKDWLPVTDYASISFVFGIIDSKNKTGLFVNPPERDMFWPDLMGGGYHYMKMNGKWKATGDTVKAFNFHLGISMKPMGNTMPPNYFTVTLPLNIHAGTLKNTYTITMNIEKWLAGRSCRTRLLCIKQLKTGQMPSRFLIKEKILFITIFRRLIAGNSIKKDF